MTSHPTPLLSVRSLGKVFTVREGFTTRHVHAVNDVSFDLQRGEVVALVGESGSGKSTIARLIARLMPPTGGQVLFEGSDALAGRRAPLSYRSRVQMIFQDPFGSLNPVHNIRHHLERPLLRHGKVANAAAATARVEELLETVGLSPGARFADQHPHQLSGGQRQRVAIARALAVEPQLILADEPTSMLDVSIRVDILNLLRQLKEDRGIATLYITHDLAAARYFADRTLVLYAGHVVESAPSGELMDRPAHPYTQLLLSAVPDPSGWTGDAAATPATAKQMDPGPGCPFADRCARVVDRCRRELPPLEEIRSERSTRCFLRHDDASDRQP